MERKRKLTVAKTAVVIGVIPLVMWALNTGPDRPASGAPGETVQVEPSKWRRCGSRSPVVEPTAQMSDVELPDTLLTVAQIGVAAGDSRISVNALPVKWAVSVRLWQPP